MKSVFKWISVSVLLSEGVLLASELPAQVEVNLNLRYEVGGVSTFEREKFITLHSVPTEADWGHSMRGATNFTANLLEDFMVGRDVYFGRDTGYIGLARSYDAKVKEDADRPGWVDAESMVNRGAQKRAEYKKRTDIHRYDARNQTSVTCGKYKGLWPNGLEFNGWAISTNDAPAEPFGSASGDFMGLFLEHFHSQNNTQPGQPAPGYVEIVNEPDWHLLEWAKDDDYHSVPASKLWEFHKNVAVGIRAHHTNSLIGGYASFNPNYDKNEFSEWNDEWKTFVDIAGAELDFWSLHVYDQPAMWDKTNFRKGANLEAMFDLIDFYSEAALGVARPYVISEFGSQTHEPHNDNWTAHRDWLRLKAMSSMTLSFMDRPHLMLKTIPYVTVKAEWGRNKKTDVPWHARLMRQANEPESYTGEWVYTELVHYYDLWADVNGARITTSATDPDIQVDAYAAGAKVYLILNNIVPEPRTLDLGFLEAHGNTVQSVRAKHLYWSGDKATGSVVYDDTTHAGALAQVKIEREAAMVLELTMADPVKLDATLTESKYFASTYRQPIHSGRTLPFIISDVAAEAQTAMLRVGIARAHALSKQPTVMMNGTAVIVPADIMGYEKDGRFQFFGTLLIPVPVELLQAENRVDVTFPDSGGHISTVALKVSQ